MGKKHNPKMNELTLGQQGKQEKPLKFSHSQLSVSIHGIKTSNFQDMFPS